MGDIENIDWELAAKELLSVIEEKYLPKLRGDIAEIKEKLAVIAKDVVKYWQVAEQHGPDSKIAAENMTWLKSEMRLLWGRYAIKQSVAVRTVALTWIEILARIGAAVLRALVRA